MIRLGLRLTLSGGREAAVRLAVTAAAVAVGVGMLLVTLAAINGIKAQSARGAWLVNPGTSGSSAASHGAPGRDPLVWLQGTDQFDGRAIERVDVAATGPGSPVPPGIPRVPGPGQFYASPALSRLLRSTPAARPARSARRRSRPRTRWSSSSGTPRGSWRARPARRRSPASQPRAARR